MKINKETTKHTGDMCDRMFEIPNTRFLIQFLPWSNTKFSDHRPDYWVELRDPKSAKRPDPFEAYRPSQRPCLTKINL
jgi:hypothetical protein